MHRRVALAAVGRRRLSSPATLRTLPRIDPRTAMSDADIDQLSEEGAIVLRGVLAPEWIEVLREAAEANLSNPGPLCDEHSAAQGTPGRFHDDQFLWRRHPEFAEYVLRSGAGSLAARAMRSSSAHIFYDQLFVKEPGTSAPTPWHNDTSYWHMEGKQICSIWLALDDVLASRGLSYVKGSHKRPLRHKITNFSGDAHSGVNTYSASTETFDPLPDVEAEAAAGKYELLRWDVKPGDALIFYSAMLHGAPGNSSTSGSRRRGYATRWCGDDVLCALRPGTMAEGWARVGLDAQLSTGQPISLATELHPNCSVAVAA